MNHLASDVRDNDSHYGLGYKSRKVCLEAVLQLLRCETAGLHIIEQSNAYFPVGSDDGFHCEVRFAPNADFEYVFGSDDEVLTCRG